MSSLVIHPNRVWAHESDVYQIRNAQCILVSGKYNTEENSKLESMVPQNLLTLANSYHLYQLILSRPFGHQLSSLCCEHTPEKYMNYRTQNNRSQLLINYISQYMTHCGMVEFFFKQLIFIGYQLRTQQGHKIKKSDQLDQKKIRDGTSPLNISIFKYLFDEKETCIPRWSFNKSLHLIGSNKTTITESAVISETIEGNIIMGFRSKKVIKFLQY